MSGPTTVRFWRKCCACHLQGRHLAFEPLPHLCAALRDSFPDVDVHQAALSNRAGHAEFAYVHGPSDGWSGLIFRPLPAGTKAEVEYIDVPLEVLDEVIDPDYVPALIKIDVEGAEQQVIEGAMRTLRRHQPIVIFEHGLGSANVYGTYPPTSTACSATRPTCGSSTSTATGHMRCLNSSGPTSPASV